MLQIYARKADRFCLREISNPAIEQAISPALWYDLLNPTPEEDKRVEKHLGISIPTREEMHDLEPSEIIYTENGARYMTARVICQSDTVVPKLADVTFILTDKALVTVRCGDVTLSEGRMGLVGDRVAIRVTKPLRKPHTSYAMFEKADERTKLMEAQ